MCKHFMHKIASPLEFCRIVESGKFLLSSNDIDLKAPINGLDKVICIGVGICQFVIQNQNLSKVVHTTIYLFQMNYVDHCTEQNIPVPKEPVVFNKFPSCE